LESAPPVESPQQRDYVVQDGDSLFGIALAQGVPLELLLEANADLADPNILNVGQVIRLPELPATNTQAFKIIPANRLVRDPGSTNIDVAAFIASQPGFVRNATDIVDGQLLSAAEVVEQVSLEFSVDARLLLALLELRSRWLSNPDPDEEARLHPLGAGPSPLGFERDGLYRQLTWAADQLNAGYYGRKYRNLRAIGFDEGLQLSFPDSLNAATVGVQYMLSQFNSFGVWQSQIGPEGLYQLYIDYFGDPFVDSIEPLVPPGLVQPTMQLPFAEDEIWYFTGGAHGGWGSGSAWAAIDFAPPDDLTTVESACYVSETWAQAAAPGIVARTDTGVVVLDLDGDGDEATGWSILYLHLVLDNNLRAGMVVNAGDRLGRPSCEGGFSNGTHIHIARRYNGEWLPAHCDNCVGDAMIPDFVLGEWAVISLPGQEYQGFLRRGAEQRIAEQGRLTVENLVGW
jgi:murein DD-endopeptidase MepM/ murein hydrolase activator NlpD